MNKIIPSVIENNGEYYIHMEEYKKIKELGEHYKHLEEHYKHLYSEVKKQKDELEKEMDYVDDYNRHLLKQKDDVVEYIKHKMSIKENYMIYGDIGTELLRMLGEIDNE